MIAVFALGGSAEAQTILGVNWGGNYTSGTAVNFAADNSTLGSYQTGDYGFDGTANDRAQVVGYGTVFSPTTSSKYVAPTNTTGRLYTAAQIVNFASSTDPLFNTYRISGGNPNALQNASAKTGVTTSMEESVAFYSVKADFLGGLNSAANVGFANAAGGATLTTVFQNIDASSDQGRLLVENGTSWFVSSTVVTGAGSLSASYNPADDLWYAYDPSANEFLDLSNLGTGVAGSTFTDIQAFGVFMQTPVFDGTSGTVLLDTTGFSASMVAIPEPSVLGFLLIGGFLAFLGRRRVVRQIT